MEKKKSKSNQIKDYLVKDYSYSRPMPTIIYELGKTSMTSTGHTFRSINVGVSSAPFSLSKLKT